MLLMGTRSSPRHLPEAEGNGDSVLPSAGTGSAGRGRTGRSVPLSPERTAAESFHWAFLKPR